MSSFLNKLKDKKRLVADIFTLLGFMLLIAGIGMFLAVNEGIFFSTAAMTVIFSLALLIMPTGYIILRKKDVNNKILAGISIALIVVSVIMLVIVILNSLIIDYVQPLALNTANSVILIAACVFLIASALVELITGKQAFSIIVSATLIVVMLVGIVWANTQGYGEFNKDIIKNEKFLFENGEGGYATFRIPSILALDHEIINEKYDYNLEEDVLLASAEGRKNSSHDTGSIDLVYKTSKDGGKTWSDLNVLFTYKDEVGKYGNPTPVLDRETGLLNFPYMTGTEANKYDYKTYNARLKINPDMTLTLNEEPQDISFEKSDDTSSGGTDGVRKHTLMIGPGKSIQISQGEHAGRLIVPASSGGESFVMYSDDNGITWTKGGSAGVGNECEAAELGNGELVMVVRDMTGCSNFHPEQYQRLSYSKDGGENWYIKTENTDLRSPICMSSVDVLSDGRLIMTYPDSFHTRVNLTLGISKDNGKTFEKESIYKGAAGYSCVTSDSNNNVYVLAEIGKINYNEVLYFAKLDIA